ncbi:anaerobic ribonucleoside-triphosphate reductase activating protein [Exiguobacterium sp. RIT594]|uniref:anaerobic ribonucleoside-triphosphate reductase activating protein n=1 Tax=Exiguobacterium sp. RIT594 TaxID=2282449 RepID=UPI000DF75E48|nr:anaerobic ribonucleoside-triphosphate reductase activating protein [Exiguobacterium sp. RIT594]RDB34574.1 anaerobic ribonucleoside-triphosphate reductase activating protein [Exiguobacterium sp. RIT594]
MRLLHILADSVVDGPGLRTVIFFAGCPHQCAGCHNPESWAMDGGADYTVRQVLEQIEGIGSRRITISGGEPFLQRTALAELVHALAGCDIYLFTGYRIEQLLDDAQARQILSQIDGLVDGRYIKTLHDSSLSIRGSTNQRILTREQLQTFLG